MADIKVWRLRQSWLVQFKAARWLWFPLLLFGLSRLGIAMVAYIATPIIADPTVPPRSYYRFDNTLLDAFGGRWDGPFYVAIAERGYVYEDVLPSVAFFPLLPLLIYALTPVFGNALLAGLVVANLALLCATMLLYQLVAVEWSTTIAERTIWYLLIFPTSFFGSAIYSESLFLLGSVGALYSARRGFWLGAGLFGILTTSTRAVGIVVAPMLLVEWWMQRQYQAGRARPSPFALLAPFVAPLGLGLYMVYLQHAFGDPLAFMHAQEAWGRISRSPLSMVRDLIEHTIVSGRPGLLAGRVRIDEWMDLLVMMLFLGFGCCLFYYRRWSEGIFVVLGTAIPLSTGFLASGRRYVWVLFPVFVLLARWGEHAWVDRMITVLSLLGLGLFTAMFVNWYWVA